MTDSYLYDGDEKEFLRRLANRGEIIQAGVDYWRSKGWPGRLPARRDIDPLEFGPLLKSVVLLDVEQQPMDFVYRVIGTEVVTHLDRDHTGRRMSEIDHQRAPSHIWSSCCTVAETASPMFSSIPYVGHNRFFLRSEDAILPLSDNGSAVNKLLVFVQFVPKEF